MKLLAFLIQPKKYRMIFGLVHVYAFAMSSACIVVVFISLAKFQDEMTWFLRKNEKRNALSQHSPEKIESPRVKMMMKIGGFIIYLNYDVNITDYMNISLNINERYVVKRANSMEICSKKNHMYTDSMFVYAVFFFILDGALTIGSE